MCICVCVYMCMYVCMYVCTYVWLKCVGSSPKLANQHRITLCLTNPFP